MITLNINGKAQAIDAEPDTPLLYVLRNDLQLYAAKFGCGLGQMHRDDGGRAVFFCLVPIVAHLWRPLQRLLSVRSFAPSLSLGGHSTA